MVNPIVQPNNHQQNFLQTFQEDTIIINKLHSKSLKSLLGQFLSKRQVSQPWRDNTWQSL